MHSVEGFILVGGASSRMGKDKSRLKLGGMTLAEVIAGEISKFAGSAVLVGRNADDLGLNSTTDVHGQWGALGGLHAALANCKAEWALVTACDLPFVSVDLFRRIASFREGFDAVAPVQEDGYPQPLCALFRVDPCLERAEALIQAGERRPIALLNSVRTRWVAFEELRDLNGAEHFFDNINTPEDYVRAAAKGGSLQAKRMT